MSTVLSHPLYTQTTKNLERTAVRDKILRLIQYFSRFASWWAYRKGYSIDAVKRLKIIQKQLSLARKVFRAGKPLANIRAFVAELHNETSDRLLHLTTLAKNFGQAGFLTLDTLVWVDAVGAAKLNPKISDWSNRMWVLSLAANLVQAGYLLQRSQEKIKVLESESEKDSSTIKLAYTERKKALTALFWNLLDMTIPLTSLGYTGYSDGTVGLAGLITSYLGLREIW